MIVTANIQNTTASTDNLSFASFGISGTTTLAASDQNAVERNQGTSSSTGGIQASTMTYVTLTAGAGNVFTMQYRVSAGTATIIDRTITVIPLN